MRIAGLLSTLTLLAGTVGACGLSVQGLDGNVSDGGGGLDGTGEATTGSSGGGSSGGSSSSGGGKDSGSGSSGAGSSGSSGGVDSGGSDSTTGADAPSETTTQPESSVQDVASEPPPQETGTCTTGQGCYVIPGGWQLVAFTGTQSSGCPGGFSSGSPVNLVEGPNTSGTCSCGSACTIDKQPDCQAGAIGASYDVTPITGGPGSCGSAGQPAQMNNSPAGSCSSDMYNGSTLLPYSSLDLAYAPANQLGGHCNSGAGVVGTVTFDSQDRACPPDSAQSAGCNGNQCTPTIPSPYQVCVIQGGNHGCPGAPFTQQHLVGSGFGGVSCSSCASCTVQGTCSGGTMKLFENGNCNGGEIDIPADGKCHTSNAPNNTSYNSYKYVANAPTGVGCAPSGTSTASGGTLTNEQTICCAP